MFLSENISREVIRQSEGLLKEEILPIPLELLFLRLEPLWVDDQSTCLLEDVLRKNVKLIVISVERHEDAEVVGCKRVRQSSEIGIVRVLGQGIRH